jgi:hypothetical protein
MKHVLFIVIILSSTLYIKPTYDDQRKFKKLQEIQRAMNFRLSQLSGRTLTLDYNNGNNTHQSVRLIPPPPPPNTPNTITIKGESPN